MNDQKKTSPEFDTDKDLSADEAKPATADQDTDAKDSAASVSSDGAETPNPDATEPEEANELPATPVEAEVEEGTAMMPYGAKPVELKEPYHGHVSHQLMRAIPTRLSDTNTDFERAAHGSIALYSGLDPRDPHESILDRLAVAGLNAAMEANAKSVNSSKDAWVSEKYTRIFCQNSAAVVKLLEARDKHRARQTQTVTSAT